MKAAIFEFLKKIGELIMVLTSIIDVWFILASPSISVSGKSSTKILEVTRFTGFFFFLKYPKFLSIFQYEDLFQSGEIPGEDACYK